MVALENTNFSFLICLAVSLSLGFILSYGGADYMTEMLRSLQIIVHLPLFKINFPANVMVMTSILIEVAMFDILGEKKICSFCNVADYFEFDQGEISEHQGEIPQQIQDLGYETHVSF